MFTGLVEEIGKVKEIRRIGSASRITIAAKLIMDDLPISASVAINGACQTVIELNSDTFAVEAVEETIKKTTLGELRAGDQVNLERAVLPTTRMGGHFVQGHVDCAGAIESIGQERLSRLITIRYPREFDKYLVRTGSIAVDGISLTTARVEPGKFTVSVIPYTIQNTTLSNAAAGRRVNLEFDILGKYFEKYFSLNMTSPLSKFISQPDL